MSGISSLCLLHLFSRLWITNSARFGSSSRLLNGSCGWVNLVQIKFGSQGTGGVFSQHCISHSVKLGLLALFFIILVHRKLQWLSREKVNYDLNLKSNLLEPPYVTILFLGHLSWIFIALCSFPYFTDNFRFGTWSTFRIAHFQDEGVTLYCTLVLSIHQTMYT